MRQIVVATFDQRDTARAAIAALANAHFDPRRVHAIESRRLVVDDGPGPASAPPPASADDGTGHPLREFLAGLFGATHDVSAYAAAMRRGGAVVRIDVDDPPQAARAEQAFAEAGAIDITRRSGH